MRTATWSALATLYLIILLPLNVSAQSGERDESIERKSIHRIEQERHRESGITREEEWDSVNHYTPRPFARSTQRACSLEKRVFGWHPYWQGTSYNNYDYSLLSDISYFSYEVDPATGRYLDLRGWKTTELVTRAKEAGVRVHLCATLFTGVGAFLANASSRATLIDSLLALVKLRDGDGVNIDFEGVPASARADLASFMADLASRFHAEIPGSEISIALPAVDWNNAFDVAAMAPHVDLFLIMGYDFHWRSAPTAGPVAPKNSGTLWGSIDITRSIDNYLAKGIPPSKLALAVPYYGYDWPTADSTIGSATTGSGAAVLYASAKRNAEIYGRRWESQSSTPYYIYRAPDSTWHQAWYDDEESLRLKYDLVKMKNLAGIGIWALGYDDGRRELWDLIESSFTSCALSPCSGTFTDMGGPAGNYYNNESYIYTIAPENARSVTLSFFSFNVADDMLTIYDGSDTTAPVIGSYTGTTSPGTIASNGGEITLKFTSNGASVSWGWIMNWSCTQQPQDVAESGSRASRIELRASPNPSSGAMTIEYHLPRAADLHLSLIDMLGVERLSLPIGFEEAGVHRRRLDLDPHLISPGAYIIELRAGDAETRAMVIVR